MILFHMIIIIINQNEKKIISKKNLLRALNKNQKLLKNKIEKLDKILKKK